MSYIYPLTIEWDIGESRINYDVGGGVHVLSYECEQIRIHGPWELLGCEYEPSFLYQFDKWWDWKAYGVIPIRPYEVGDEVLAEKYIPSVEGKLICTGGQYVHRSSFSEGSVEFILVKKR